MTGQAVSTCNFNDHKRTRRVTLRTRSSDFGPLQWLVGALALNTGTFPCKLLLRFPWVASGALCGLDMKPKAKRLMTAVN